jgi:hypothetical protein
VNKLFFEFLSVGRSLIKTHLLIKTTLDYLSSCDKFLQNKWEGLSTKDFHERSYQQS